MLITYFAEWPFASASPASRSASLTFAAWVRAIAFLCGRHNIIFRNWDEEDSHYNRKKQGVGETDLPVLEYLFRGLATSVQHSGASVKGKSTHLPPLYTALSSQYTLQRDVLDVLNTIEPMIHLDTPRLSRSKLVPTVDRLCALPAPPSITSLAIPLETLAPLLDLSLSLIQHTSKFDMCFGANQRLIEIVAMALNKLQNTEGPILYDFFLEYLGDDIYPNIYDAVALVFTTFPSPKIVQEGIMLDPFYRHLYPDLIRCERRLNLLALREPGSGHGVPLEKEDIQNQN